MAVSVAMTRERRRPCWHKVATKSRLPPTSEATGRRVTLAAAGLLGGCAADDRLVKIIKAIQLELGDLLVDEFFDGVKLSLFVGRDDGHGVALALRAAGATDAVNVVFSVFGYIIVNNVSDIGDVEPARSDISRYKDLDLALFKLGERLGTRLLR